MKPEEVIELLKIQLEDCTASVLREDDIDLAIQALEKQVPKKPIGRVNQLGYRLECPRCTTIMAYHSIVAQYCWVCGQAIEEEGE